MTDPRPVHALPLGRQISARRRLLLFVFLLHFLLPFRFFGATYLLFPSATRPTPGYPSRGSKGCGVALWEPHAWGRVRPARKNPRRGVRGADIGGRGSIPVPES